MLVLVVLASWLAVAQVCFLLLVFMKVGFRAICSSFCACGGAVRMQFGAAFCPACSTWCTAHHDVLRAGHELAASIPRHAGSLNFVVAEQI
jgi:hypothetical protein